VSLPDKFLIQNYPVRDWKVLRKISQLPEG